MAVPFRVEGDSEDHSYLRIENLLKELLTLLRWMPWTTVTGMPTATAVIDNSQATFMLQRRQTAGNRQQSARGLVHHHRRLATATAETHNRSEGQQQQLPLPDLITSTMSSAPPPPPPPPPPPQPSADKKPTKKILLEVELCPECYYDHQKFKVVAANRRDKSNDGLPLSRRHRSTGIADRRSFDNDAEESVVVVKKSNVKQRLMSLLTPSKIDSSILTAVFVIIGWKMFIKQ
ncbi:uncharacterized protein LOC112685372 [Sipha flava]|uniref:Uncharacterized protein LOC112685372 n=2 Tax=Sipha flava TaxID=143950 RepID=A0A8B8FQJ6_9HEMI|nr:uncharacterized protein LOC112685372 [Sipha flava]